jgi:diguanylate cyclase (GGDEF)-like protein
VKRGNENALLAVLGRWPYLLHAGVALLLLAVVGFLDLVTGYELGFSLFYLLPVCWCAWFLSRAGGLTASAICTLVWVAADLGAKHPYSAIFILYWNAGLRLGFFVIVALLLAALRDTLRRVNTLSRTDSLTEAANPRAFEDALRMELGRVLRYRRPLAVAYIDLDNFKSVNDRFGHSIGNQALRTVAGILRGTLRRTDVVGRVGGDEFALILPETGEEEARVALYKLRGHLRDAMVTNGWPIGFSIGCVTCLDGNRTVDELLELADEAMYKVKANGKDSIEFRSIDGPSGSQAS